MTREEIEAFYEKAFRSIDFRSEMRRYVYEVVLGIPVPCTAMVVWQPRPLVHLK